MEYLWEQIKRIAVLIAILGAVIAFGLLARACGVLPGRSASQQAEIEWYSTDESTAFSRVGYDETGENLFVVFRSSGKAYMYSEFPPSDFSEFIEAESLGSFYNQNIKGQYPSERYPDFDE